MIISIGAENAFDKIDAEKAFNKIQHPFIQHSPESGHRENLLQYNKGHM